MRRIKVAEAVRKGHPDKLCDLIADTVLDRCLADDPMSRVAVEVMATRGRIVVAGEVTSNAHIDYGKVVRDCLTGCGYRTEPFSIHIFIHGQSADIAAGVDDAIESRGTGTGLLGAGDQGTVYGHATDEGEELMPLPLLLSQRLCRVVDEAMLPGVLPDGKCQVGIEYDDGVPSRVDSVVVSLQTDTAKSLDELEAELRTRIFPKVFTTLPLDGDSTILVNPSGRFNIGGPDADTGLTGRKLMVDTYGGLAPHGGGAFSGKDPTKMDRSAAYMARSIARSIVKAGLAHRCTVALSYAIGVAEPVAVSVDTHGTGCGDDDAIAAAVSGAWDLRPDGIISSLGLRRPLYGETSSYGHFGHPGFPWEQSDRPDAILEALSWMRS